MQFKNVEIDPVSLTWSPQETVLGLGCIVFARFIGGVSFARRVGLIIQSIMERIATAYIQYLDSAPHFFSIRACFKKWLITWVVDPRRVQHQQSAIDVWLLSEEEYIGQYGEAGGMDPTNAARLEQLTPLVQTLAAQLRDKGALDYIPPVGRDIRAIFQCRNEVARIIALLAKTMTPWHLPELRRAVWNLLRLSTPENSSEAVTSRIFLSHSPPSLFFPEIPIHFETGQDAQIFAAWMQGENVVPHDLERIGCQYQIPWMIGDHQRLSSQFMENPDRLLGSESSVLYLAMVFAENDPLGEAGIEQYRQIVQQLETFLVQQESADQISYEIVDHLRLKIGERVLNQRDYLAVLALFQPLISAAPRFGMMDHENIWEKFLETRSVKFLERVIDRIQLLKWSTPEEFIQCKVWYAGYQSLSSAMIAPCLLPFGIFFSIDLKEEMIPNSVKFFRDSITAETIDLIAQLKLQELAEALRQRLSATVTIQRFFRTQIIQEKIQHGDRSHLNGRLPYHLFDLVKPHLNSNSNAGSFYRNGAFQASSSGRDIYYLKDAPIVVKPNKRPQGHVGYDKNGNRWQKIEMARQVCTDQGLTALTIPRTRVYGDHLVEDRLSLGSVDPKAQMVLYCENLPRFAEVAKQFVIFLSYCDVGDILNGNRDPYQTIAPSTPLPRYDNLPFYLDEEGQGKMALIDLECLSMHRKNPSQNISYACNTALCFFPYHVEEIWTAVRTLIPNIKESEKEVLIRKQQRALERFRFVYEEHVLFLRNNNIGLENYWEIPPIDFSTIEEIRISSSNFLRKHTIWYSSLLKCSEEEYLEKIDRFNDSFVDIINFIHKSLSDHIRSDETDRPLLLKRSNESFERTKVWNKMMGRIIEAIGGKKIRVLVDEETKKIKKGYPERYCTPATAVLREIFTQLMEKKIIYYFNPFFGYGCYATTCAFL